MLIFNCTKATQDFFTVTRQGRKQTIVENAPGKDMSEDAQHLNYEDGSPAKPQQWVLHEVTIKRKHCLVAMEVDTRFAIIVMSVAKADAQSFLKYFYAFFTDQVAGYGEAYGIWPESETDTIVNRCRDHLQEVRFVQRSDRSVQTHINEVVRILRDELDVHPDLLTDNVMVGDYLQYTNDVFRKSRAFPDQDYIIPMTEMFIYWQREYRGMTPQQLEATREKMAEIRRSERLLTVRGQDNDLSPEAEEELPPLDKSKMIMPGNGPLSSSQLDFLDAMLLKYETETSVANTSSLHGFLTAIVSGPNSLPPSYWLPGIWGDEDSQPDWDSDQDALQFMNSVFQMMNGISEALMVNPQDYAAIFSGDERHTDVSDWCYGYMGGVELDEDSWEGLPFDLLEQLTFLDHSSFITDGDSSLSVSENRALKGKVVSIAQNLHAHWLKQRSTQKKPDNPFGPRPPQQPVTAAEKIGRNEPCPCGSGKKFKKCCLH